MADLQTPHDRFFRDLFARPEAARDFVRHYLPTEVVECVDLNTLEPVPGSFVDPELREHLADAVFSVSLKDGSDAYVYVLIEHKSHPDRFAAFQVLRYIVRLWERALRETGVNGLPAVIPVVLYHGRSEWRAPRDVGDLVEAPEGLAAYQPRLRYELCDLGRYGDEEIRGAAILQASLLVLKHIFREDLRQALPRALGLLRELVDTASGLEAVEVLLRYVTVATDTVGPADLERAVTEALGAKGEEIMPTIAQKWIEQGMEKGLQRGLQQGLQQGLMEGQIKAAREDVIDALEARFEPVPGDIVDRVRLADDPAKLKILLRQAVRVENLDAFRKALRIVLG
ncbi:Rpn family recombination-promoting nuclease/putative transposase [Deferrisoma camini]|uniref:Rpn family recombination-promoting nuclease/putative transposase n=1 Tax=Deferrisoma camini TaxID=1035120 RepID=UPI00046D2A09|nr:Rpn family recombination-promoting nuclease/putative transposase [Deferrisoma camini]